MKFCASTENITCNNELENDGGEVVDMTNLNGDLSVSYDSSGVKQIDPRATGAAAGVADEAFVLVPEQTSASR